MPRTVTNVRFHGVPGAAPGTAAHTQAKAQPRLTGKRPAAMFIAAFGAALALVALAFSVQLPDLPQETPIETAPVVPFTVAVQHQGGVERVAVTGGFVRDALALAGVDIGLSDEVEPALYAPLAPGMCIRVTHVEIVREAVRESIPYQTIKREDGSLAKGKTRVKTKGQPGEKETISRVTYRDGVVRETEIMEETVVLEPVDEVIRIGTKKTETKPVEVKPVMALQKDDRKKTPPTADQIKQELVFECTAYTHTGNRTATGTWPSVGTVAVNPGQIAYGTKLYIEGYGYGVAADTGGFRHSGKRQIDLFMDTVRECVKWGRRRNVRVFVLK